MGNEILLMDGAIYEEWTPTSHDELVQMLREHYKELFGPDSLYIEVRHTLRGGTIGAIPDSYCLTFNPDKLWVVEVELSAAGCFNHIQNQLNRFLNGLFNPVTRQIDARAQQDLRDALFSSLAPADQQSLQTRVGRLDPWLEGLISTPSLVVVTDNATDEVRRACGSVWIPAQPLELRTFRRVGAEAVHIHQFEPLSAKKEPKKPEQGMPEPTFDTIVVPAREEGFRETFLGENRWYAVRIDESRVPHVKYIAGYQAAPVSAITHWAPVRSVEPCPKELLEESEKATKSGTYFVVNFSEKAKEIGPIRPKPGGKWQWVQGPSYTTFAKLRRAKNLDEVFG